MTDALPGGNGMALFGWDGDDVVALLTPPDVLHMTGDLLRGADARWMEVEGDIVDIHVANGRWVYEIVERCAKTDMVVGHIRYREALP